MDSIRMLIASLSLAFLFSATSAHAQDVPLPEDWDAGLRVVDPNAAAPPSAPNVINDDQLLGTGQKFFKAVHEGDHRGEAAAVLLLLGYWLNRKVLPVVLKDKQYQSFVPWVVLAMAEVSGIGTALAVPGVDAWAAMKSGANLGAAAIAGWELVGKHLLDTLPGLWTFYKEEEAPKLQGLWTRFKAWRAEEKVVKAVVVASVAVEKVVATEAQAKVPG